MHAQNVGLYVIEYMNIHLM